MSSASTSTDIYRYDFSAGAALTEEYKPGAEGRWKAGAALLLLPWLFALFGALDENDQFSRTGQFFWAIAGVLLFLPHAYWMFFVSLDEWQEKFTLDPTLVAKVDSWASRHGIAFKNTRKTIRQIAEVDNLTLPAPPLPWTVRTRTTTGTITLTLEPSGRLTHT